MNRQSPQPAEALKRSPQLELGQVPRLFVDPDSGQVQLASAARLSAHRRSGTPIAIRTSSLRRD
ncbi:MAG TPA: hypothetical protein PK442_08525, partial [Synergistales bacterium]|nr:hypothetical protein [Synergistales bacterium]